MQPTGWIDPTGTFYPNDPLSGHKATLKRAGIESPYEKGWVHVGLIGYSELHMSHPDAKYTPQQQYTLRRLVSEYGFTRGTIQ